MFTYVGKKSVAFNRIIKKKEKKSGKHVIFFQDFLQKLASKFLERTEAKTAEEAEEVSAITGRKQAERLAAISKAQQRMQRSSDERYQEINRALLLSEVNLISSSFQ
jgi:hypothetical protein